MSIYGMTKSEAIAYGQLELRRRGFKRRTEAVVPFSRPLIGQDGDVYYVLKDWAYFVYEPDTPNDWRRYVP